MRLFIILFMSYVSGFCRLTPKFIRSGSLCRSHSNLLGFNKNQTLHFNNNYRKESLFFTTNVASIRARATQEHVEDKKKNYDFSGYIAVFFGIVIADRVSLRRH